MKMYLTKVVRNHSSYCSKFFYFWRNLKNKAARAQKHVFLSWFWKTGKKTRFFSSSGLIFKISLKMKKIWNSNLNDFWQLLLNTFSPPTNFIFRPLLGRLCDDPQSNFYLKGVQVLANYEYSASIVIPLFQCCLSSQISHQNVGSVKP